MRRNTTQLIRVGKYAAEVAVELIIDEDDWSPSFSLEDAQKLDAVRQAMKNLGVMLSRAGRKADAAYWLKKAGAIPETMAPAARQ